MSYFSSLNQLNLQKNLTHPPTQIKDNITNVAYAICIRLRESEISSIHDSFPGDEIILVKKKYLFNDFIQFLTANIKMFTGHPHNLFYL